MKINQKSPIVDTWRAALSVPAGYLTREGTEESEINLPLESVRCSRRASIGVQEQRESTLPYVGSWIIIVPRKHDNLYRKNRFLVVARIGQSVTVRLFHENLQNVQLTLSCRANFIIYRYITSWTVNEYRNMNIHRVFLQLERILDNGKKKKVKLRLSSDNILSSSSSPSVFRKRIQNSLERLIKNDNALMLYTSFEPIRWVFKGKSN